MSTKPQTKDERLKVKERVIIVHPNCVDNLLKINHHLHSKKYHGGFCLSQE